MNFWIDIYDSTLWTFILSASDVEINDAAPGIKIISLAIQ